ncbi:MAG TPA: CDP-glucose 4,6-dehydratase [Bacteroidales bacterium]|nr:CDP-glucose 4,6-dehydratase [Bacteroidales bacterium]HQJ21646.1 CDP-glucose 4,6-dehydratase [Bacteroidales bacterium]
MVQLFNGIFKGRKVLITGDTGFKGSWLAIWLLKLGADVFGYSLPPKTEQDNFVVTNLCKRVIHKNDDIRNRQHLLDFFEKVRPEFAFHLAAQPLVLESYKDPHYTFETNIMGTVNFFEAVRMTNSVKVALNITSDKCYRNNEWVWGYRENDPLGGKDPYSASKGCSELITDAYLTSFFKDSNCRVASVRAGNVIGAGDWANYRIIPDYFRALQGDKKLIVRNPEATRPWQHVLEPLSGYLMLAAELYYNKEFCGSWNFGPRNEMNYTVIELVNEIKKYETSVEIIFDSSTEVFHESKFLKLDISKAVRELGWKPVLDFNDTVRMTINGYLNDIRRTKPSYEDRLETIKEYINISEKQNVKWSAKK